MRAAHKDSLHLTITDDLSTAADGESRAGDRPFTHRVRPMGKRRDTDRETLLEG